MESVSSLAIITAVYGAYDDVKPAPPGFDDRVLVTDRRDRAFRRNFRGWRVVSMPIPGAHPRVAAKIPKCRPDWFTAAEASVWVDGSFRVEGRRFADLVRGLLSEDDLIVSNHPESTPGPTWEARNCLYDEALFSAERPKYVGQPVVAQAEHYLQQGMPRQWGLWALGIIGRRHTPRNRELGLAWLLEMERWTVQDQISFPYLLWRREWRPATWPFHLWENPYLSFTGHNQRT